MKHTATIPEQTFINGVPALLVEPNWTNWRNTTLVSDDQEFLLSIEPEGENLSDFIAYFDIETGFLQGVEVKTPDGVVWFTSDTFHACGGNVNWLEDVNAEAV